MRRGGSCCKSGYALFVEPVFSDAVFFVVNNVLFFYPFQYKDTMSGKNPYSVCSIFNALLNFFNRLPNNCLLLIFVF
jgi:hypothetical protein